MGTAGVGRVGRGDRGGEEAKWESAFELTGEPIGEVGTVG
jgi:hypothetical protein